MRVDARGRHLSAQRETVYARRRSLGVGDIVLGLFLAVVGAQLLVTAVLSLHWPIRHDAALIAYMGMLVDRFHWVPYRDFFDVNLPATHLLFAGIERLVGVSDTAFRAVDLLILVTIIAPMGIALRAFGNRAALTAPVVYGLAYIALAQYHALQRESFMLVCIATILAILSPRARLSGAMKAGLSGGLLGAAACIKPAILIDAIPIGLFLGARQNREEGMERVRRITPFLLGLAIGPAMTFAYLVGTRAWAPFVDIAEHYWPLFGRLGGLHQTIQDQDRFAYLCSGLFALGGHRIWLVPAAVGTTIALQRWRAATDNGRFALLLLGLLLTHAVYPAASGQFYPYHWLPLVFSLSCVSSLCAVGAEPGARGPLASVGFYGFIAVMVWHLQSPGPLRGYLAGAPLDDPDGERVAELTTYLGEHLHENDTVQPLDWTGGSADAMLRCKARLATPFVCDFQFYHHVSTPYIQSLRRRFIDALRVARPTYIIRIITRKPWVQGVDTTREFPELDAFLAGQYAVGMAGDGYQVLIRVR